MKNFRGLFLDTKIFNIDEINKNAFYQEFRRSHGLGSFVGYLGDRSNGGSFQHCIQLPFGASMPSDLIIERFAQIGRHLDRASAIAATANITLSTHSSLLDILSELKCAAAIVGSNRRIVLANTRFTSLSGHGINTIHGQLSTPSSQNQNALDRLVHAATEPGTANSGPPLLVISRSEGRRPLVVRAIPLPGAQDLRRIGSRSFRRNALITITDLDEEVTLRSENVLQALGLTRSEARLTAIVGAGQSLRAAAEILGLSEITVRSYLKDIFLKLSISKQTELVNLINKIPP